MKLGIFPLIIALLISVLVGWFSFTLPPEETQGFFVGIGTGVQLACALVPMFALDFPENPRLKANVNVLSTVYVFLLLVANAIFCFFFTPVTYICVTGLLLLLYLLILPALIRASKTS